MFTFNHSVSFVSWRYVKEGTLRTEVNHKATNPDIINRRCYLARKCPSQASNKQLQFGIIRLITGDILVLDIADGIALWELSALIILNNSWCDYLKWLIDKKHDEKQESLILRSSFISSHNYICLYISTSI